MTTLLLKNLRLEDPAHGVSGPGDLFLENGRIADLGPNLAPGSVDVVLDMNGALAVPGLVDLHVHLCGRFGNACGFGMLARAGVCTALNMTGPTSDLRDHLRDGCGLNIATLEDATPGFTLSGPNPDDDELDRFVEDALARGAIGIKILGGHYPLTPDASARLVRIARNRKAYVAWHAGTTAHGSNIDGMREVFELIDGAAIHLAHVNSYCRGLVRHELDEVREALELLEAHPNVFSESYISPANGTSLRVADGRLASRVTAAAIGRMGFADSREGMAEAIRAGLAYVLTVRGGETVRVTGEEGLALWEAAGTNTPGSLDVNPPMARLALAVARRASGAFTVDCLATDGGSIPRNVTVPLGLGLVASGGLTLADFIRKTSFNPARILGLENKGHFTLGADADITVLDLAARRAEATIVGGQVCMLRGLVTGRGGTLITSRLDREAGSRGHARRLIDLEALPLSFRAVCRAS